jgi:amino acid adenylation domain-containing protein/non-ribosomal peptide synthase protein (TIGR01720 family)
VHELFETQADRAPEVLALVAGDDRRTFAEVEARANRLAHRLRRLGVRPDTVVGLCVGRTADLVVGLLGILKAGGAYLPLDPTLPRQRIADLLEEAGAPGVVAVRATEGVLPEGGLFQVCLDAAHDPLAGESEERPAPAARPGHLVYVLFTSGSTGRPKGVAVEHRNLVAYVRAVGERLALPADASYAHVSSLAADLGNTSLFPPLCLGGTLHLLDEERTKDGAALGAYFEGRGIDVMKIAPTHLSALLASGTPERVLPRRTLVMGGEALGWDLVGEIRKLSPRCRVHNHYGPTETTVGVVAGAVDAADRASAPIAPLGRPLRSARIYVLDEGLEPAPIGVPGEVYVGGVQVARGYLGRPDLTAERFVPDPFDPGGARVYRTGDRACWLASGALLFLGRADHQVKIRGFRVELGEIDAALEKHPAVRGAVVLALDDAAGGKRLAAFVVAEAAAVPEIQARLASALPAYMVPGSITALDAFPLLPNGKVDRRALEAREARAARADEAEDTPRGPVEEVLEAIWADVFGREHVGVHERFDALGGHSLLAIQVIARVRDAFQVEVPLRAIFEAPTIAELAGRVEALRQEGGAPAAPPIERAPRDAPLPLSFAQERLWFLDRLEPNSSLYNVPSGRRLSGPLDAAVLERALREVVRRHEVLRTTFTMAGGRPVQVIHDEVDLRLPVEDLGALPEAEREARLAAIASAEATQPFDLERGPVLRARLVRLGREDHVLWVVLHHIASDAWTQGILHDEVAKLYAAFLAGKPSPLPDLPLQYADFAAWQRRWLSDEVLEQHLAWWRAHLAGAPAALEMPTDRPRPPVLSHRGRRRSFTFGAETRAGITALARREGATLFMVMLAAFDLLLCRHTGQRDVVVGTPIAGRTRAETEGLIGFFVNTLALRTEIRDEEPFRELLARVREACLGAFAHQDLPFERLVEALRPARDLSRTPIFQAMLVFQSAPREVAAASALSVRQVGAEGGTAKFDLNLSLTETPRGFSGSVEYATDLFDAATMDRLLAHLRVLLEGIAEDADRPVCDLPILPADERRRLLGELSDGGPLPGAPACMHRLFEEQVDRTPEATALVDGDARVSYRALDERANRLAHHLRSAGVGPGVLVGLGLPRSAEMVVGMLAILKAGGAYVPVDLAYPPARIAQFLEDAHVIVTRASARATLPETAARAVLIDAEADAIAGRSAARPDAGVSPRDLGYVLYTSGSTGRSKGVAIEHRSAAALVRWAQGVFSPEELARVLFATSICFDLSVFELFVPLSTGGAVVVAANALALPSLPARGEVTLINTVPSAMAELVRGGNVPPSVTTVCLAGEPLPAQLADQVYALPHVARLFNLYGPTEDTTYSTWSLVERGTTPNIGRAIAGSTGYVLDAHLEPVPVGVVGELYLGGAGLARGYHGRPDLTAERFVPDPFGAAGGRLYRTGDLTRYRADGALEYLGRADHLVKVRGFRIELGEIEAVLLGDRAVREAVVVVREDAPGDKRIVAYVAPAEGAGAVAGAALGAQIRTKLPEYMVPSAFVVMDALPRTQNGKVDRKALPAPDVTADVEHVAPEGPVEEAVVRVFAEVLRIPADRVGARHGFFELGGHSLLATQAVSRLRETFGVDLPVRALFEAPAPADLAARIEAALRAGAGVDLPPIVPVPRGGPMVLSFAQERLWFLQQLDPGDVSYLVPSAIRLGGALDRGALARALDAIVQRHEVLRTRIVMVDGAPRAVVDDGFHLDLPIADLAPMPEAEREAAVRGAIAAEMRRPFDLAAPPIRARLFALAGEEHVLFVVMHHVATDGWSVGVLQRELSALYQAFHAGQPSPLPALPLQYADYAAWQRGWLSGEVLDRQLAWWRAHLAGAPAALDLPADRPRPAVMSHRGARHPFSLPASLQAALVALARREGATLFMVVLAAFDVLLSRHAGQGDVVVGTPIAGRTRAETEGLIGFFVNTLALRAEIRDDEPFRDLLARVREACLGAYAHQDLPFERLVQDLEPARDLSRTPVFQAMLMLQNAPQEAGAAGGLARRRVAADAGTAKFELTLTLNETPAGIAGNLEYVADLFDAATIARMVDRFRILLEGIAEDPGRRVIDLPMLAEGERAQVLSAWNDTAAAYPADACVHALVEAQAARTPGAVAVAAGADELAYRDLDLRANRLARHLGRLGVGPGSRVGLCVERSPQMVVAMIGVLKAGAAYVPMDPTYPRGRLAMMVEDAGLDAVVSEEAVSWAVGPTSSRTVLLDGDRAAIEVEDDAPIAPQAGPESIAYVIYTSGSTGTPKGVEIPHRAVVNFLASMARTPGLDAADRLAAVTSLSFDIAGLELLLPLTVGARVEIVRRDESADGATLRAILDRAAITVMQATPSTWRLLLDAGGATSPLGSRRGLLKALVGGEAVPRDLADALAREAASVWNMYGPTETTIWSTVQRLAGGERVLIGRPIANTQVYVLDAALSPSPIGVPGELYIAGDGLARGYLGRPALTAERFVPDPFGPPGARMYRTGDLARWIAGGALECLGRVDHQIKLRGFRIELGEIEAALASHPAVREAAAIVREDAPGDRRLAAYVVAADPASPPSAAALRAHLRERLPDYMVPSAFTRLDALPLTPNGKVDRKALPRPDAERGDEQVAARGPIEEAIAGIFAEVLRLPVDQAGARESFFDMGGHSLLATQVVSRLRETLGVDLPVRALFEAPSPAELATRVEAALRAGAGMEIPPLTRVPREGPVALSFAQERLWFLHELDPGDVSYLVPVVIRLEGPLDRGALARTLDAILERHEVLRTRIATVDGAPVGVVDDRFRLDLPVVTLADLPEADREAALREALATETSRPIDLSSPPIRARLFVLGEADHVLSVVIHHIATDAWSAGVLSREVGLLYEAFAAGRPSPLPALPVEYADYAAWQRRWLSGEILDRQLAYWKAELDGAPDAILLPTDRPRPAVRTSRGGRVAVEIPAERASSLRALASRHGATLYMVLLAALDVLLARLSGQGDVVVGSPIAGRTRAETEGMVGLFLNMLALRGRVDLAEPFTALLARVKESCLGAYAHQDLPFERLVQELATPRDPSRTPVFQVVLNLQNAPPVGTRLPGLRLRGVGAGAEAATTKFDLTFILSEGSRGVAGTLSYRADLFDAATAERMVAQLATLLEGVVTDPSRPVGELPLLGAEDRRRLLAGAAAADDGRDVTSGVHALFEAQVDRTPGATALVAGAERISFADLDARANRVAHRLRRLGVGSDGVVGLCTDRTADLLVGLLGILKAGGAYVPLDPTLPRQRLADLLDEARALGVVTAGAAAASLPEGGGFRLALDGGARAFEDEPATRPGAAGGPDDLVYVLFTSGSTGRPKGVAVAHRNLVVYVRGVARRLEAVPGDAYAHVSTLAADLGNTSLFLPLCVGGTLHLVPEDRTRDPAGLAAYFEAEGIDVMKVAPSHFAALLTAPRPERVVPRRALVLGGEALSRDLVDRVGQLAPGCRVFNHYGPTETCVGVIAGAASALPRETGPIVPLGWPLDGARVHVLDPQMEPAPVGVPGEVFVGGAQVARGYLGRPDQTAERFVPDPFGPPGARLYATGDRARLLPAGPILFLGRADHQVKVRGFRVELGEIEAVIARHPGVREAVVLALDDAAAGKRLAAFATAAAAETGAPRVTGAEIGAFLASILPGYMVPASITVLDALPITPNGKVDRRALEALDPREEEQTVVAPRTATEELLEAIWADVFNREHVGVHDRFDALGGHSLLAIQVIARVRDAFQVEVPLRAIFEAPTIAELAARVDALAREGGAPVLPPIERAPRDAPLPLSFAQERLWFLDRLEPGSALYNVPSARRFSGPLDAPVLERALREVVRRHEVLRTTFAMAGDQPVQVIRGDLDLRLPVEDLGHLPEADREPRAREIASTEARRPFDLERGPLIRVRLLRLGPDDHVLIAVLHHIVSDAWTQGVLLDEVGKLYAAFRAGEPSPLPPLPVQYADYAVWQRRWLAGDVLDQQIAWWKAHLAGAPAVLDLPTDRPRPPVMSHRGARQSFALPLEASRAIAALGRREGATLFMVLLAAFYALLARYTGQRDLVVGTPIAGRTRAETEGLIGFFVNTLALRAKIEDDPTFLELLARVRETCLGAYAHQDLPFERLVDELNPARDLSRTPVFQVLIQLQNAPREAGPRGEVARRGVAADSGTAKFDLTLTLGETPRGITGTLEYASDLFDAATIARMLAHFHVLLEGVAQVPERRVLDLPILPEEERAEVVVAWNGGATVHPRDAAIDALFEAEAQATPDAVAVEMAGTSLTYRELARAAHRLAHRLAAEGIAPGSLVGLYAQRSIDMVVAMLAILEAGAAYVPLDPEQPDARLAWIAEDLDLRIVLAAGALPVGRPLGAARVLDLGAEAERLHAERDDRVRPAGPSHALAYAMYTSGSTGRPKGVGVQHRNVVRLARGTGDLRFDRGDVLLQISPLAFDASTLEIWAPLLNGGRLAILPPEAPSVETIGEAVRRSGVTAMWLTAALFNVVVEQDAQALCGLGRLFAGGEALSVPHVQKALAEIPGVALINGYGPTENTTFTTTHRIARVDGPSVPIGRPIAGTQVYVLDERLEPAPVGVPGELYAGGDGVARGYLNRPDLTAERFVPDPFGEPGTRLYRTGDRVRWLADGTIQFLGRLDAQIKLRGFRIELGEIEAALLEHVAVRDAVVILREDAGVAKRLVAYVVAAEGIPLDTAALRPFLKQRLPEYAVPSAFVALPALPLTPNGKVDKRALPVPELPSAEEHVAPAGPVEETLCRIFAEVLRIPRVGVHDNFFAIGGDSILSIQIVARARTAGITLTPRMLFLHQTIAELAAEAASSAGPAAVEEGPVTGPVPLTPIQRWWLEDDPADAHHFNQAVLLESRDPVDPAALEGAVRAVFAHHDALRLRVSRGEGGWEQRIVPFDGTAPFEHTDLGHLPEADRSAAITSAAERAQASLDLSAGPLMRVLLFTSCAGGGDRLFVVVHHFAVDGVSWRILLDDLWKAYEALRRGEAPALPPRTTSIQRWAQRLVEHAQSDAVAAERAYWLSAPRRRVRRLPVDHPGAENTEAGVRRAVVSLSPEETETLLRVVPAAYHTQINDVLLAAFAQALSGWTGADAVLVDLEGHGREDLFEGLDLTRTVGWFTVMYPMVLDLHGCEGPGDALASVKEQLRAVPGHGIGYGLLRYLRGDEALRAELAAMPQAEVSFNYLGQLDQALPESSPLSGARESAGPLHSPRAKRRHAIDVLSNVVGGRLHARFAYAGALHEHATMEKLADRFVEALRAIIEHCASGEAGGPTPSDLLEPGITDDMLDFMASLDPTAGGEE